MSDNDDSQKGNEKSNSEKKAQKFDIEALFVESREKAQERCREVLETRQVEEAETREKLRKTMQISLHEPSRDNDSDEEIGPPIPTSMKFPVQIKEKRIIDSGLEDDSDEYTDEEAISVVQLIPTSCEVTIRHGSKPVGSKYATGGLDYKVNYYDFARMDVSMKPFREISPVECHVINSLAYSLNGENLIVASGNAQARILDRKGSQWTETVRGDQYLVDLSFTKGHTGALNGSMWNPLNKDEFMTCSDDGTVRLWNLQDNKDVTKCLNVHRALIKTKTSNGKRAIPTSCSYSRDAKLIAAGCDDGSLQIWKYGKLYVNTTFLKRNAHNGSISSIKFSYKGNFLLSRGIDDTLKLWDLHSFKEPVHVADGLDNLFPQTECGFSPGNELVFTGTSTRPGEGVGKLIFFDINTFKPVYQVEFPDVSCIRVQWHPKINQILVGLSNGMCKIFYDPLRSVRGVLQCVTKPIRRERKSEVLKEEIIMSPLTMQMFQPRGEEGEEKEVTEWRIKKFLKMQSGGGKRPQFRKPAEPPMSGPSAGGRVAASGGTLHSYVAQHFGVKRNRDLMDDTDVRSSILRHAEEAAKNPMFVQMAYAKTQPVPIFQEKTTGPEDEEPDEELQPMFKMQKT